MTSMTIKLHCKRCRSNYEANVRVAHEERKMVCPHCNKVSVYGVRELLWAYQQANGPRWPVRAAVPSWTAEKRDPALVVRAQ